LQWQTDPLIRCTHAHRNLQNIFRNFLTPLNVTVWLPGLEEKQNKAMVTIELTINKHKHKLTVDPRTTLLDLLREEIELTGTKKGCDHGQCGACTVLIDGKRMNSCLQLAVSKDGSDITTIEGLAEGERLHPLQVAFLRHDAFQCGYCTPGQICSALGMIQEKQANTREEVRELMSGNLCRCSASPNIIDAIMDVLTQEEQ